MPKPILLCADDEEAQRELFRHLFEKEFEVLYTSDGREALDAAEGKKIAVAIVDIQMPRVDGMEVLRQLALTHPSTKVIMLTGYETVSSIKAAFRAGAFSCLAKPVTPDELRNEVLAALKKRSLAEMVESNTRQLIQLKHELVSQKEQTITATAAVETCKQLFHDQCAPLTVICALVEYMKERMAQHIELDAEHLIAVRQALCRMTGQVTVCIETSRRYLQLLMGRERDGLSKTVNHYITLLMDLLRLDPQFAKHHVTAVPLAEDIATPINGTDLFLVLLNLSKNSLQSASRPVQLTISATVEQEPALSITDPNSRLINAERFRAEPPYLCLSVKDDGDGCDPNVFDTTASTKLQGHGLGLQICKRFVCDLNRGLIYFRSVPGSGTLVKCFFSMKPPEQNEP